MEIENYSFYNGIVISHLILEWKISQLYYNFILGYILLFIILYNLALKKIIKNSNLNL